MYGVPGASTSERARVVRPRPAVQDIGGGLEQVLHRQRRWARKLGLVPIERVRRR